ncbi:MAG: 2-oxoglutarate dehydrogenase complex dihydrolipoyllysine-residue succinyltransferase [Gammaproteobacteria bacterium]|jgi:2-oxoglutarate dehydrogenase E2 component (dihydrolipoamide succinyltransferase)|nr:2-oxoglutarate dehydrogenase complex dihydrolipoyllysine-residue succinyltransferase [Gammaproteobacteria bacterium]
MSIEIKVPQLPESITDATLVVWHKKPGEAVARDENLVDLETDKVVLEVPAPASGVLKEVTEAEGATVVAGQLLAILEEGEAVADEGATAAPAASAAEPEPEEESSAGPAADAESERAATSPAVRRMLEEHDLDATLIPGSGKQGRITKADVLTFLKGQETREVTPDDAAAPAPTDGASVVALERTEKRVPMSRLRARIAERLVEAQQTAAMLTTFNEVDLSAVMALRSQYKDAFEKQHGVKLGFMSFFAKASVTALKKFPVVNASVEGQDIVYHNYYDIGVAVSTERGLMVPVLRDVDQMSFAGFESELTAMAQKAQKGTISMDDLTGGTFTITNGGIFGSMLSTPILNQPQSAILGMHNIEQRPRVVNGEIVARPMMYLALTYDHRIIDGKEAVQFLVAIKEQLEDPSRLLLNV